MIKEERNIIQNTNLGTLVKLGKEYMVTLEIKMTQYLADWTNVIHFTTGVPKGVYGCRIPSVWIQNTHHKLYIASAVNGNFNSGNYSKSALPIGKWISIVIKQMKVNGMFNYSIFIDGLPLASIVNMKAAEFENVTCYASNPSHAAQPGLIKKLIVYSRNIFLVLLWCVCVEWMDGWMDILFQICAVNRCDLQKCNLCIIYMCNPLVSKLLT